MHSKLCQAPLTAHTKLVNRMVTPPAFQKRMQRLPSPQQTVVCTAAARAAVGIDLGTTNSVVAVLREGDKFPKVLHDVTSGTFTVPSVVAYTTSADSPLVGEAAKQQAVTNSRNTFYSVKRLMGRSWEDAQGIDLVYELQPAADGAVDLVCPALQTNLCPQQVSAEILKYLLSLASRELGATPQQVVITVPAYFNAQQRVATLEAAHLAGIQQVSLLQEPVAAAMAFGFGKPCDADTLLVFDLGGGTYDLSAVESFEGIMEVLATGGDAKLGGDDFDQAILQGLCADHPGALSARSADDLCSNGSNGSSAGSLSMSADMQVQLLKAIEEAKRQLSTQSSTSILLPGAAAAAADDQFDQPQQSQESLLHLTQLQMHKFTAPLRSRLWSALQPLAESCKLQYACEPSTIEDMLQRAASSETGFSSSGDSNSLDSSSTTATCSSAEGNSSTGTPTDPYAPKPRQLTAVLLVGGATRMPIIQRGLQVLTGLQPRHDVDPEQAVALGASIHAAVLLGLSSGVELMDGSYVEEMHQRSTGF